MHMLFLILPHYTIKLRFLIRGIVSPILGFVFVISTMEFLVY